MINDDVEPAVITKIRLSVTLIVNNKCYVRGANPAAFPNFPPRFLPRVPWIFWRETASEKEKESVKLRLAGDNGIGHDSVAAKRETIY